MTEDARARGSPTRAPHSHLLTPFVPEQRDAAIHQKSNHRSCLFPLKEAFLIRSTPELPPHFLGEFIPEHPRGGPRAGERETPPHAERLFIYLQRLLRGENVAPQGVPGARRTI